MPEIKCTCHKGNWESLGCPVHGLDKIKPLTDDQAKNLKKRFMNADNEVYTRRDDGAYELLGNTDVIALFARLEDKEFALQFALQTLQNLADGKHGFNNPAGTQAKETIDRIKRGDYPRFVLDRELEAIARA